MINDLKDLFIHHIQNLYAAEIHMLAELPAMMEKVHHRSLKNALTHHMNLTNDHKERLEQIVRLLNEHAGQEQVQLNRDSISKGMMGLIDEAKDIFAAGLQEEVADAAIIACIQKMEHYEITSYGTALAYAGQLHLPKAQELLKETLNEEYDADDLLTALATASLNKEAVTKDANPFSVDDSSDDKTDTEPSESPAQIHITERTINSPGGRAGTSHRRYGTGESRGH